MEHNFLYFSFRMNCDDLPSWVFFPDKERAEWVNNIMKQLWPYVNEYDNC